VGVVAAVRKTRRKSNVIRGVSPGTFLMLCAKKKCDCGYSHGCYEMTNDVQLDGTSKKKYTADLTGSEEISCSQGSIVREWQLSADK
jgi:hypothetical protein